MAKNKILFVNHEDNFSGSTIVLEKLLSFILKKNTVDIFLHVYNTNKNKNVFTKLVQNNSITLDSLNLKKTLSSNFLIRIVQKIIRKFKKSTSELINSRYNAIFFNSISFIYFEQHLAKITLPKYLYLHEQINAIHSFIGTNYTLFYYFEHIFVPCNQSKQMLIELGVNPSKISVLQLYLTPNEIINSSKIDSKTLRIGNLANISWPKGIEYFLATAKLYNELYPQDNIKFIWKGAQQDSFLEQLTNYEIQKSGLASFVDLLSRDSETTNFYNTIDVLLLTSKEESFGLVCLEAANHKVPCVIFKDVVGAQSFIEKYDGFVVNYLSIFSLVHSLKKYYDNRELINQHGNKAKEILLNEFTMNKTLEDKLANTLKIINI